MSEPPRTGWLGRLFRKLRPRVHHGLLLCRDLGEPPGALPDTGGVRVERVDLRSSEFERLMGEVAERSCRGYLRAARAGGWQCYLARIGGEVAGMTFVLEGEVRWHERRIRRLRDDERYMTGAYVLPPFRGRKVFHRLKLEACGRLASAGVARLYSVVNVGNAASLRVNRQVGSVPLCRFTVVGWMRMNFVFGRRAAGGWPAAGR